MVSLFCMTPLPSRIPEDRGEIHKEGAARRRSRTGVGQDGAEDVSGHDVRTRAILHEPRAGRSTEVPAFFRATYAAPMEGLRVFIIARRVWLGVGAAALAGVIVWRIVGRRQDQRLIFRPAPPVSVHERAGTRGIANCYAHSAAVGLLVGTAVGDAKGLPCTLLTSQPQSLGQGRQARRGHCCEVGDRWVDGGRSSAGYIV